MSIYIEHTRYIDNRIVHRVVLRISVMFNAIIREDSQFGITDGPIEK